MATIRNKIYRTGFKHTYRFFRVLRTLSGANTAQGMRRSRKTPVKIFTNVQASGVGGIGRVISSFADYLQSSGESPHIRIAGANLDTLGGIPGEARWLSEQDAERGMTNHTFTGALPSFTKALENATSVQDLESAYSPLMDAFHSKLKEERPDIVLINGTYFVPWCLMLVARAMRLPTVLYYHGSITKETAHWKDERHKRLILDMETSFDHRSMKYIFPSLFTKQTVEQEIFRHRLYQKRAIILPNAIPDEFFDTSASGDGRGIGFVGRWAHVKNTAFVKQFADMKMRNGDSRDIHVVTDPHGIIHARKALRDTVTYVPPMSDSAELAAFYARMGAVVCPSHFETYGNVAQESVAAGTPAFVSPHMGIAEIFRRIGLGHLVLDFSKPRRAYEAIEAMRGSSVNPAARNALREETSGKTVHQRLLDYITA